MPKLVIKCPKCGCEELIYDDWEYDEESATREIECSDCGFMWVWVFTASHSENRATGSLIE